MLLIASSSSQHRAIVIALSRHRTIDPNLDSDSELLVLSGSHSHQYNQIMAQLMFECLKGYADRGCNKID